MPAETYFSYTNLTAFGNGYGFHLYNSSSLWTFNNNISATANHPAFGYESGIYGDKQYNCNTLVVNSGINSVYESGIHIEGNYNTLKIGAAGTVSGKDLAIRMLGDYSEIINDGTINGTAGSVEIVGNNYAAFTNNNKVLNVIKLKAKVISVVLGKNSYLAKQLTIDSAQGDVATIVNDGNAGTSPGVYVFFCGPGRETLINKGTINGAVNLDGGDDTFDNRGGKGTVIVDGGDDHDTFIVDTADVGINESIGKGVDTVQSTVTLSLSSLIYESEELEILTLIGSAAINGTGNDLDNTLTGNAAANVLQGLGGTTSSTAARARTPSRAGSATTSTRWTAPTRWSRLSMRASTRSSPPPAMPWPLARTWSA